jgi:hypothetical protein
MNEKCLIVGHLGLGDLFIINGLVRYFSEKYKKTFILCKNNNLNSVINMFSDNKSIYPISINTNLHIIPDNHYIYNLYNDEYDIIKIGIHNNNWYIFKSNFNIDNLPLSFYKTFYEQLNIEYNLRYKYEKINRNYLNEIKFYKNVMKNYLNTNNKYIFIHNKDDKLLSINTIENIPIFDPNLNYYKDNKKSEYFEYWNGIISNNIIEYSIILENSYEIHLQFSSFFNLCMFLDLSKVNKKYLYTNISNIKDFHLKMNDWNIIYN